MAGWRFVGLGLLGAVALAGCDTMPVDYIDKGAWVAGPTLDQLYAHIRCRLHDASPGKDFDDAYVAQITLTLKVTDTDGLTPSLSFITPYSGTGSPSYTRLLGATLTGTGTRNFTASYTIDMSKLPGPAPGTCAADSDGLSGDLELASIVKSGLEARNEANVDAPQSSPTVMTVNVILDPKNPATTPPNVTVTKPEPPKPGDPVPPVPVLLPTFGSTVEFTVVRSLNIGPLWALRYFKGPSGSTGLVNAGRTNDDTLVISFAPKPQKPKPPALVERLQAANTAVRRLIGQKVVADAALALLPPGARASRNFTSLIARTTALSARIGVAQSEADDARRAVDAAPVEYDTAGAVAAAQALTTTMILQNLGALK